MMKKSRKIISIFMALLLAFGLSSNVLANSNEMQQSSLKNGQIQTSITKQENLRKNNKGNQNYLNPNDYPLIKQGSFIDSLVDSVGSTHLLTYSSTTEYTDSKMEVSLKIENDDYYKDPYLDVNFYTANNGEIAYIGTSTSYLGSYSGVVSLGITLDKSLYQEDPYIYMRIGTYSSNDDSYYSDSTYFKVVNPFYNGASEPPDGRYFELISNESPDENNYESTGYFQINNEEYSFNKKMDQDAYKLDFVKPFDPETSDSRKLNKNMRSIQKSYQVGANKSFWVTNVETNQDYQLTASLLYSGKHANVWVHNNQLSKQQAEQLGKEFDDKIYTSDVTNFGNESDVDGDGKVNILTYDIQDGFSGSGGYVAGYFSPQDLYAYSTSNRSEIFYIDTYPLMGMYSSKDVSAAYSTLAHEFEHMINYNQKVFVQGETSMDVWMDEGLAMAAEQIYLGEALQSRIDYYNSASSITNGHSLIYWDYYGDTLANYSLSYLFMQYVKEQAGQGNQIFKQIINNKNSNYLAIEEVMQKYTSNITFGQLMTNFRGALTLKEDSGPYGFKGNASFDSIKEKLYNGNYTYLQGGGAIVKAIQSEKEFTVPASKGQNITYTLLTKKDAAIVKPATPSVTEIGDSDLVVRGKADKNTAIVIAKNKSVLATGYSDSNGSFAVSIPRQAAGTKLVVYAERNGVKSEETTVTVKDKTAPPLPKVNSVSDSATVVTGTVEAKAKVTVKAGSTILGQAMADEKGAFQVKIVKQKAGTKLIIYAEDAAKNKSKEVVVKVVDKTAPVISKVNPVGDTATSVTGITEAKAIVTVKAGSKILGKATADTKGAFQVKIVKQKAGTKLIIYAEDAAKNKSKEVVVKVVDKTAPVISKVNPVGDTATSVTGITEAKAIVTVKAGSKILGKATADTKGAFQVKIAKQKLGTKLTVYAEDAVKNKSKEVVVKVVDKTAPSLSKVNSVSDSATAVTGKTEAKATVTVKAGSKTLGKAAADAKGTFKVKIAKQKAGTKLTVYAEDAAKNKSKEVVVKVVDKTAPSLSKVNSVSDSATAVTGKTEAKATVTVKAGSKTLGKAAADAKGTFKVKIAKQKAGTKLTVYAEDAAKNKSKEVVVKVADKTAPAKPTASTVTTKSTSISGKAEKNATVYVYKGKSKLGKSVAGKNGTYKITIKKQKKHTVLTIYAQDKAGNKSKKRELKVK
ncbi:Ig-like domain-containing protein [Niallia sp. FSL R7-0648]|uniref:Ig-like domain-containing protein n=1 Tax=Niallia sp. FSL R7-0648 TaxID=2954521 RepID=UPI0030F7C2EE